MSRSADPRSLLPGVNKLLERPEFVALRNTIATPNLTSIIRRVLDHARTAIAAGGSLPTEDMLTAEACGIIDKLLRAGPHRVINATGVILHTGLGRAPLSDRAIEAVVEAARYCDLEFELDTGQRGDRQTHVEELLCWLTGAEAALVVNNNAAALYLTLNALAFRREVVVSRGQLIEIGGSFRLPEIMARSGCKLIEVGTTNRTRARDYAAAISDRTAMLLRAYPSNYRIDGFTESVEIAELAALAKQRDTLCVDDLGGGLLWDWTELGLPSEPSVAQSLGDGADLVLVSGDKVIGGPQAGIILGKKSIVATLKRAPLARVLRAGKLELAALASTLTSFLHRERPEFEVPTWRMLSEQMTTTRARAARLKSLLTPLGTWQQLDVVELPAQAGSGTLPAMPLPSCAIACLPAKHSAVSWARKLRAAPTPVIPVIQDETVYLNLRTVSDHELDTLFASVRSSLE
ncbi:MAG: L-seryl-tRNA(Sec) selenium transferase [bacterium]|nr:L-seryl-tRNA(Sec) selenium transferase [bacterium]